MMAHGTSIEERLFRLAYPLGPLRRDLLPTTNAQWQALVDEAITHHVHIGLLENLHRAGVSRSLPAACRKRLMAESLAAAGYNLLYEAELDRLARELHDIACVLLKGALLEDLYGSTRPQADIDILVERSSYERARAGVERCGFTAVRDRSMPAKGVREFSKQVGQWEVPLDMHCALLNKTTFRRVTGFDSDAVWGRLRTVTVGPREFRCLADEDALLYLSVHFAIQHEFRGLLHLMDLCLFVEQRVGAIDWEAAVGIAKHLGGLPVLACILDWVADLCQVESGDRAWLDLRAHGARLRRIGPLRRATSLAWACGRHAWAHRRGVVRNYCSAATQYHLLDGLKRRALFVFEHCALTPRRLAKAFHLARPPWYLLPAVCGVGTMLGMQAAAAAMGLLEIQRLAQMRQQNR